MYSLNQQLQDSTIRWSSDGFCSPQTFNMFNKHKHDDLCIQSGDTESLTWACKGTKLLWIALKVQQWYCALVLSVPNLLLPALRQWVTLNNVAYIVLHRGKTHSLINGWNHPFSPCHEELCSWVNVLHFCMDILGHESVQDAHSTFMVQYVATVSCLSMLAAPGTL